jgi:hypothetical protein
MRAAALVVLALAACGGSTPPPDTPSGDTSSLETKSPKESPQGSAAPAASAAPATDSAPAPSAEPAAAPAAAPAFHQAPSVTGTVDGKTFTPKVAQVVAPMKKDGRVLLALTEGTDCPAAAAKKDETTLTLLVPWQDGYKVDLGSLKRTAKKGPGEITFKLAGKKEASATFKPSGTVTIVSAPMDRGATGKMKIDMQSGDYMLAGDLDVEVCVAPK